MNANELMIGNYIMPISGNFESNKMYKTLEKNEGFMQINALGIYEFSKKLIRIEPIPITEKWLLDLGFVLRYYNEDKAKPLMWKVQQNRHIEIYFEPVVSAYAFKINSLQYSTPINYVYQLQNLYFSLTGKPLRLVEQN